MFKTIHVTFAILLLACVSSFAYSQTSNDSNAVAINRVGDVIEKWDKGQHLYVKGDLLVSKQQLSKLESWLDQNAKNWTIVLMMDAQDESYRANDGRFFQGMDAAEYALGHGLANRTDFGSLTHPETGETNGAVFVLFLKERKFSYYGSDIHDRRGIGESRWIGDLDREAIRAMRNGGRIIDAVKNTVTSVDRRLNGRLAQEKASAKRKEEAAKRAKAERVRAIGNLQTLVESTSGELLNRVEDAARKVRTDYPEAAQSKLVNPPVEAWRLSLIDIKKQAADPKLADEPDLRRSKVYREVKTGVDKVRSEVNRYLDLYAGHMAFDAMIDPVEARIDAIADHPSGVAAESSLEAYRLLDEARSGHGRGQMDFAELVEQADQLAEQGEQALKMERQRVEEEARRKSLVRKTVSLVASAIGALFLGLLWILNIRRRPALRRAYSLFDKKSKTVNDEIEQVEQIVARAEQTLGSKDEFAKKRYEGDTLLLGQSTHQKVDQLKQMATEANRVLEKANDLIHPGGPLAEAANMFSGARYEHCVNELNGKSLKIPGPINEDGNPTEPTWVTFDELFGRLHVDKAETVSNLDEFETSTEVVHEQIDDLQEKINQATDLEKKLARASRLDRFFRIPSFFDKLIPSSQEDCDRAGRISSKDPVSATSSVIPRGRRKIEDGLVIANAIHAARENMFPKLDEQSDALRGLGFDERWINELVESLGEQANQLVEIAAEKTIRDEATQFESDVIEVGERAKKTLELAKQVNKEVVPSLSDLQKKIEDARGKIASELGISGSQTLTEEQYDPNVELAHAKKQLDSAKAALDYGGVASVLESLELLSIESAQANHLVESSLTALKEFGPCIKDRQDKLQSLSHQLGSQEQAISDVKQKFADTALDIQDQDFILSFWADSNESKPTLNSVYATCSNLLTNAESAIHSAKDDHESGGLLKAANVLDLVGGDLEDVQEMFGEITDHCFSVHRLAKENAEVLETRTARLESFRTQVDDSRTQPPTLKFFQSLLDHINSFKSEFHSSTRQRDPFDDSKWLSQINDSMDELESGLRSDRQAFDESVRAVKGARLELVAIHQLVATSINDGIPDSATIKRSQDEVTSLEIELDNVSDLLDVPHNNWQIVDGQANSITSRLGTVGGRLRSELEKAQLAVALLEEAANKVYEAANWSGAYNIVVVGNPGSEELEHARVVLSRGNYDRTIEFSKAAKIAAQNAIEEAKRQVKRHRRKLAREAEERRRRRRRGTLLSTGGASFSSSRRSSRSSFGSSSSRSRSSSFGSSSRSSSSRSSSRSSGSGFSRSGW